MRKAFAYCLAGILSAAPLVGAVQCVNTTPKKENVVKKAPQPAFPRFQHDVGFSFSGDYLYWKASQSGMAYGIVKNSSANPVGGSNLGLTGNSKNVDFQWNTGFRAIFGLRPHYDGWQMDSVWTHLNATAKGATNFPNVENSYNVVPGFLVPSNGTNGINAQANWRFWYNTVDFDIHKGLSFRNYFGLKPHVGVRALWLNQKYDILSLNNYGGAPDSGGFYNTEGKMVQNIWGIGPMIALDSLWNMFGGFSLFGKASLSLMWSCIHSTNRGSYLITPPVETVHKSANFHTTLPEIDLIVGGKYDVYSSNRGAHFGFRVCWELRTLLDVNYLGASSSSLGNFDVGGPSGGVVFDF